MIKVLRRDREGKNLFNCLYSNASSQGNKQGELKFLIRDYKFHLLGIT